MFLEAFQIYEIQSCAHNRMIFRFWLFPFVAEPARFETASKNISTRRRDPILLSCLAKGDDHISIIWQHNNNRIDLNNYR